MVVKSSVSYGYSYGFQLILHFFRLKGESVEFCSIFTLTVLCSLCIANGRGAWRPYEELHKAEYLRKLKITKAQQSDRNLIEETKYLETALVMDYSIVSESFLFAKCNQFKYE